MKLLANKKTDGDQNWAVLEKRNEKTYKNRYEELKG